MKLNHRQLEAFRALIQTGSVTEASKKMHITQPAASRLIADLEYAVGYSLFQREKKRLSPTPEALALFEEVDRSFISIAEIADAAKDIGNFQRGSLRLASLPALALEFLPRIIAQLCADKPDISISLQIHSSQRVVQCIASQQFDIGFAEIHSTHPAVESRILCEAPMVAILPRHHALLKYPTLSPANFEGENFVSLGTNYPSRNLIDAVFIASKVKRNLQIETQLSLAAGNLVATGAGVSIIDHITACDLRDREQIEIRPFLPEIMYTYCVFTPGHKPLSRLGKSFLDIAHRNLMAVEGK
ncbi:MAG: LysR substrate-binding domain-containing protein [Granulosicoccus sp.]